jgi:7-cyano-7-deazaguanine synthase
MDSTVLLHKLRLIQGAEVKALAFDYGQRHRIELDYGEAYCKKLGVERRVVDLRAGGVADLMSGSSQTSPDIDVPHGHYEEESMKATVVPNRNMIMLSIATAWAISLKFNYVAYAAHGGDHAIYPDCRFEFAEALGEVISLADWHVVRLYRPFIHHSKANIVQVGNAYGVDFGLTYSCYEGQKTHCGLCGTCVERREAFAKAGVVDPTTYKA